MRTAGIDIGSKELVLVLRQDGRTEAPKGYENTVDGHKKLIKYFVGCCFISSVASNVIHYFTWINIKFSPC